MSDFAEDWTRAVGPADRPALRARFAALAASPLARRFLVLVLLALAWEIGARIQNNPIMLPSFLDTARAFVEAVTLDNLLGSTFASISVLLKGYLLAIAIATVLVSIAVANSFARDVLTTLTAMFNPLPAIALLPIAMLWFGLGEKSLIFVLVHSVLWPFALSTLSGFETVPETLRLVGRNYGLKGPAYVLRILIPAALPAILSGLRIGWAFAWRTLIAAELVFGVTARQGGLGWFIFQNRNELLTDKVFAGLATVIMIGLAVDALLFRAVEAVTVRRWGTQR
jgi:NitT/TauT family transport system permease protein